MNLGHFFTIFSTELQKLFLRLSSTVGLVVCVLLGFVGPLGAFLINYNVTQPILDAKEAGQLQQGLQIDPTLFLADTAVSWSFGIRGFFFLPILIFIMASLSFAGEHANRSIREYALRPVPRPVLILSKWLALCMWTVIAALLTFAISFGLGLVLCGSPLDSELWTNQGLWEAFQEGLLPVIKALGIAIIADMGFATIALSVAVVTRSIAASIAILIILFVAQLMAALGLNILSSPDVQNLAVNFLPPQLSFIESTFWLADYLVLAQPPLVVGSICGTQTTWHGYLTLATLALGSMLIALWRFQRMDLP